MNFKFLIARICYPGWWFLKVQTKETFKGGGGRNIYKIGYKLVFTIVLSLKYYNSTKNEGRTFLRIIQTV